MKSIDHLPEEERKHFIQCPTCCEFIDMRDLGQLLEHEHGDMPKAYWTSSQRMDEAKEYPNPDKGIEPIDLN